MNAEKENTFRMLREEELLVTRWLCRFGWHKWTKYREPEKTREGAWNYTVQYRFCTSCNKSNRAVINKS